MLNCKTLAQRHASDYLDQQLTMRQHLGVRVHLLLCKICRRFIDQLRLVRKSCGTGHQLLLRLRSRQLQRDSTVRIMRKLNLECL